jgi:hypothetical protein
MKNKYLVIVLAIFTTYTSWGDISLYGDDEYIVKEGFHDVSLFGTSVAFVASAGSVYSLDTYNYSTANIIGGQVYLGRLFDYSILNMSSGNIGDLIARQHSTANISGGWTNHFYAEGQSTLNFSGGRFDMLDATYSSTTNFYGRNFQCGNGLSMDGNRILGTGKLSGEWLDGTQWSININNNWSGATIFAIPEPTMLLLLAIGLLGLRRKN